MTEVDAQKAGYARQRSRKLKIKREKGAMTRLMKSMLLAILLRCWEFPCSFLNPLRKPRGSRLLQDRRLLRKTSWT